MSKKSFCVFGAENYIQKEIVNYLQNTLEEGEAYLRLVCSTQNHDLIKEGKITKIINKEKPKLFKKYVQKSNHIFIDLILNQDKENDVNTIIKAVNSKKEFEEDLNIIVISSLMTWAETNPFLYYKEKHNKAYQKYLEVFNLPNMFIEDNCNKLKEEEISQEMISVQNENQDKEQIQKSNQDLSQSQELKQEEQIQEQYNQDEQSVSSEINTEQKQFIQIENLRKKFYQYRNCKSEFEDIKNLEDQLVKLTEINEKINVCVLYTGLLYGGNQIFLEDYFKKAFLQKSLSIHYDENIQNYQIPIYNVKNIPLTIFKIIENIQQDQEEEEQKSLYYGEDNQDENNQQNNDQQQEQQKSQENVDQEQDQEEQKNIGKVIIEFLTEKKIMTHKSIVNIITQNFGNGKLIENIKYKYPQNLMNNFLLEKDQKFENLTLELKTFEESFQDQIVDFMIEQNLSPIKIFFYCADNQQKNLYQNLNQTYNIRIIDCQNFISKLLNLEGFKIYYDKFTKIEHENFDLLLKQNIEIFFLNPKKNINIIIFYIKLLKIRLSMNDCKYKGFLFICKNFLVQNIQFQELFYKNVLSSQNYLKELKKAKKQEIKKNKKLQKLKEKKRIKAEKKLQKYLQQQEQQKLEQEKQKNKNTENNSQQNNQENDNNSQQDSQENDNNSQQESQEYDDNSQQENEEKQQQDLNSDKEQKSDLNEENEDEEIENQDQTDEEKLSEQSQEEEENEEEEQQEENQKIREEFFPDHFILLFQNSKKFQYIEQVKDFCIDKKVDYFIKKLVKEEDQNEEYQKQILHLIKIYLNRNKNNIPQQANQKSFEEESQKEMKKLIQKISASQDILKLTNKFNQQTIQQTHSQKFQDAVKYFHQFQNEQSLNQIQEQKKYKNNREILTKIFYDILYEGLLNIKKLNPSDPFEYLSNFVYEKSFK